MPKLTVHFGGLSVAGRKAENDDAFSAFLPTDSTRETKGAIAVVADGLSCAEKGQRASQIAAMQFIDDYLSTPESWSVDSSVQKVVQSLNSWLHRYSHKDNSMLTTLSALVIRGTTAHLFHVGDCRISRYRDGAIQPLTVEHRAGKTGHLSRALGMEPNLRVDYLKEDVSDNDVYILSSDGVHDVLKAEHIAGVITEIHDLASAAKTLVEDALAAGSDDNATCLLARVESVGDESLTEAEARVTRQAIPPVLSEGMKVDGMRVNRVIHNGTRSHLYHVSGGDQRQMVLKAPSRQFRDDFEYLARFCREEWVGLRLSHPSVVGFIERPQDSPFLYVLTELVDGITLRQWMLENPVPSLGQVRDITHGVAKALRVLERKQMVYQDLKPENVMVDALGKVTLIDLGTLYIPALNDLQHVNSGLPAGSVGYTAPECILGGTPSLQADIFSLGVLCYELLTGHLPFKKTLAAQSAGEAQHMKFEPMGNYRRDVPLWVDLSLRKAVSQDLTYRYDSYSEFLTDLSTPSTALLSAETSTPFIKRRPVLFWQSVSAALLIALLISLCR